MKSAYALIYNTKANASKALPTMKLDESRTMELLFYLVQSKGDECPPERMFPVHEKLLFRLARLNKIMAYSFHLIHCPACRTKCSRVFIKRLLDTEQEMKQRAILRVLEYRSLAHFVKKNNIKALLLKSFSTEDVTFSQADRITGEDIDVLVSRSDAMVLHDRYFSSKYVSVTHIPKEIEYISNRTGVSIDVHVEIAYPHYGSLSPKERVLCKTFGEECFRAMRRSSGGILRLPVEYQLVLYVLRFVYNDMFQGVKGLYDIASCVEHNRSKIHWNLVENILNRNRIHSLAGLVFSIVDTYFKTDMTKVIAFPSWVETVALYFSMERIFIQYPMKAWDGSHRKEARAWHLRYKVVTLLLEEPISFVALLRPRRFLTMLEVFAISVARRRSKH